MAIDMALFLYAFGVNEYRRGRGAKVGFCGQSDGCCSIVTVVGWAYKLFGDEIKS